MATFGELVIAASRRIQDDNNTAVSASEVGSAINTAIKYHKKQAYWFNQTSQTLTLNIGDPALPANTLFSIDSMRIPFQSMTYDLSAKSNEFYDSVNLQGRGRPSIYTWRDGAYQLYFYPDQAYTVIVSGLKEYPALVNDSDTNDFTLYADQLILYDALSRLSAEYRTDPTISEYYSNRMRDEKGQLIKETNHRMGTGSGVVYETFYQGDYLC